MDTRGYVRYKVYLGAPSTFCTTKKKGKRSSRRAEEPLQRRPFPMFLHWHFSRNGEYARGGPLESVDPHTVKEIYRLAAGEPFPSFDLP